MSLLYVEDDVMTRQAIAGRLRRRGYEVIEAASGEEALGLMSKQPRPAAVILDVDLPGIDGIETYRRLLAIHTGLPAVVCSSKIADGARGPFKALGVPDELLLAKPCEFQRMLTAIQSAVHSDHNGAV
ncbi:MAG TPA: response regulator [Pirellulales bacterium]